MTPEALGPSELAALEAVFERLIPRDEQGPGAREAQVTRYALRRLAGPYRHHLQTYAAGLARLDDQAVALHGERFADLGTVVQDELLRAAEARAEDPFFELVLAHAREGMFGDPAHGGNAGGAGWALIGYPGPRKAWSEQDQQLGSTRA
jgi:Gluconate 2-dehydrogenase subunit 3